ncbi:translation initiation factor eif3 [Cyclospora cayetanensis]|uniref:Translation initiation factor eif3 n=1 Tax=Cyclospora cayetanensis TaxID=88456 RepID=A0A1D3CX46_9EIME|nr:translation initiation factor eif3 [Cyclospora cayetanensis]
MSQVHPLPFPSCRRVLKNVLRLTLFRKILETPHGGSFWSEPQEALLLVVLPSPRSKKQLLTTKEASRSEKPQTWPAQQLRAQNYRPACKCNAEENGGRRSDAMTGGAAHRCTKRGYSRLQAGACGNGARIVAKIGGRTLQKGCEQVREHKKVREGTAEFFGEVSISFCLSREQSSTRRTMGSSTQVPIMESSTRSSMADIGRSGESLKEHFPAAALATSRPLAENWEDLLDELEEPAAAPLPKAATSAATKKGMVSTHGFAAEDEILNDPMAERLRRQNLVGRVSRFKEATGLPFLYSLNLETFSSPSLPLPLPFVPFLFLQKLVEKDEKRLMDDLFAGCERPDVPPTAQADLEQRAALAAKAAKALSVTSSDPLDSIQLKTFRDCERLVESLSKKILDSPAKSPAWLRLLDLLLKECSPKMDLKDLRTLQAKLNATVTEKAKAERQLAEKKKKPNDIGSQCRNYKDELEVVYGGESEFGRLEASAAVADAVCDELTRACSLDDTLHMASNRSSA